jgi:hypothetical protein
MCSTLSAGRYGVNKNNHENTKIKENTKPGHGMKNHGWHGSKTEPRFFVSYPWYQCDPWFPDLILTFFFFVLS